MARLIIALVAIAIWVFGIVDCVRTDQSQVPGRLAKPAWIALTVVLPVLGSILWIALSWPLKYPTGTISFGGSRGGGQARRNDPVAPDDDPEFLSRLDAQNRFREWERQQRLADEENSSEPKDAEPKGTDDDGDAPDTGGAPAH